SWLAAETNRLLDGARAARASAGFAWLDSQGAPDLSRPAALWITTRMTHCFCLGVLLGRGGDAALADHGVEALLGAFRDTEHGGWHAVLGQPGPKGAYEHAFVVLAGSSAVVAGRPRGAELLDAALRVIDERFWDDEAGALVESWDPTADSTFAVLDGYRGSNA